MNRILSTVLPTISLACLAVLASPVRAQQKYDLQNLDEVGDVYQEEDTFKMILGSKAPDEPADAFAEQTSTDLHRKFTSTVLAVQANSATALRSAFEIYQTAQVTLQGKKIVKRSVEGKTVSIKLQGDKPIVSSADGVISPEDQAELGAEIKSHTHWFPKQPVGIGETWNVDAAGLRKELGIATGTQSFKGTLAEAVSYRSHPCVRIHFVGEFDGQATKAPYLMHIRLEGDSYYAVDIKRLLGNALQGTIAMREPVKGAQAIVGGKLTMEQKTEWKKIAGKPVVASVEK